MSASKPGDPPEIPLSGEVTGDDISGLRDGINSIDDDLLSLLAKRRLLSTQVAVAKAEGRSPVRDPGREEQILTRLIREGRARGLDAHFVTRIFHEIIDDSVRLQQEHLQRRANPSDEEPSVIRVSFQGIEGAYSHLAARSFFTKDADRLVVTGYNTFAEAIRAVEEGQADYAMLPVENTTSGSINEVYDLLLHTRLSIVGEEKYQVRHCLVGLGEVALDHLRRVYSHPQAVAQCTHFLAELKNASVEYYTDTAMAVEKIREDGDDTQAAIASEVAAEKYGLHVLRRDLANQRENFTRFLVAARNPLRVDPRIPCKTSVVMATGQEPGSLAEAILIFQKYGVNLTKVESRPILGNPWEEMFYLDFEGNLEESRVKSTIEDLTRKTRFIKVLGCYPSRDLLPTPPPREALVEARSAVEEPDSSTEDGAREGDAPPPWSLEYKSHSRVKVLDVSLGAGEFSLIATPGGGIESNALGAWTREVKDRGASLLLASSRNPAHEGLVESARALHVPCALEVNGTVIQQGPGIEADLLLVGGQDMENQDIIETVGRLHRPVILQRGHLASLEELLESARRILELGNQQVILLEAGVRTFQADQGLTLDLAGLTWLKTHSHLPVVVAPAASSDSLAGLVALARAARLLGADGLVVPVQGEDSGDDPKSPALDLAGFQELASTLHTVR